MIGFNPPALKFEELEKDAADDRIHSVCIGAVEGFFSPEFINRIDEIVTFNRLKDEHLFAILDKFLLETKSRLAMAGITAMISDSAKRFLIKKGTNIRYGARPLRRAVREYLEYPLASLIAERGTAPNQMVHVKAEKECLSFDFVRLAAAS
jgi:ATP-dependent Clp protease ATP-binding subunit ClpC